MQNEAAHNVKLIPCISASSSGFASRALTVIKPPHADYVSAVAAYKAANDLGSRREYHSLFFEFNQGGKL